MRRARSGAPRAAIALGALGVVITVAHLRASRWLGTCRSCFGLYTPSGHPGSGYFPPFVNGNHAASVLALAAMASFGLAAAHERGSTLRLAERWRGLDGRAPRDDVARWRSRRSRSACSCSARRSRVRTSAACAAWSWPAPVLLTLGAGTLVLADGLRSRFSHFAPGESTWSNQKTRGWLAAERLALAYPLTGVGRGAFEAPAATLRQGSEGIRLIYADDILLQAASEWGVVLGLGLIALALVTTSLLLMRLDAEPIVMGLLGGVVAVAFYGGLECGFEIPGRDGALRPRDRSAHRTRGGGSPRAPSSAPPLEWRCGGCGGGGLGPRPRALRTRHAAHPGCRDREACAQPCSPRQTLPTADLDAIIARHPASAELEMIAGELTMAEQDPTARSIT